LKTADKRPAAVSAEILSRAKDGDVAAFEEILYAYEGYVYGLALSLTAHREDAEDVAQDTFLKLWRSLPQYRGDAQSLYSYVLRICRNAALDVLRRRKRAPLPLVYTDEDGEETPMDVPDTEPTPDEDYIRNAEAAQVRAAVDALPPDMRRMIYLRHMANADYAEIAELLGIPEGTVKSRLHRARKKLCEILAKRNFSSR
jgi:RNA polymerase sigma-70 factor (ECF subfamily)